MPRGVLEPDQRTTLQAQIDQAKATIKDVLRPFNKKFASLVIGAALCDLDIEIPAGYSDTWALRSERDRVE